VTYRFRTEIVQSSTLLEEARASVERLAGSITPPAGIVIDVVRDSEMADLSFLLVLGIALIYMILASTFRGPPDPLVVMFTSSRRVGPSS
jgi:multidrug efflux pump subunit AcrB